MPQLELQLPLDTPQAHARALHPPGSRGRVTLALRIGAGGRWSEQSFPVSDLGYAVRELRGETDVYLTQNRFWGHRRVISQLAQADALFSDLDYYRVPGLEHASAGHVLELALDRLAEARIPVPSFAIASGRGLALVWLHTPLPRQALPRWNRCQQALYETLKPLGADANARDAARVLRLVGTRNSASDTFVEALTPADSPWPFDQLADEVLPYTRAELHDMQVQRAKRGRVERPKNSTDWNGATLWAARLDELQKLRKMRWFGALPKGQRDQWIFLATVAMSWISIPRVLRREYIALAQEATGCAWSEREAESNMGAALRRAVAASKGERYEWNGELHDPRYGFKAETIIERLEITEAEMREGGFVHLVPDSWKRERKREMERTRKREKGLVKTSRSEYLAATEERRRKVLRLRERGMSQSQIAEQLGVNQSTISRLLR